MMNKILMFIISFDIYCQEMPIQTEETPYILKKGQFQMESNFGYREESNKNKVVVTPNNLIKMGVFKNTEIRIIYEYQIIKGDEYNVNGILPFIIGFKTKLWNESKFIPQAALLVQSSLPNIASEDFQQQNFAPEIQFLMQGNYTEEISINYNLGAKWDGYTHRPYYTYKLSGTYGLNETWSLYGEFFGHLHSLEPSHISYNNGILYQINKNMLLDLSTGLGINPYAPNFFCGIIFSWCI